MDASTFSWLSSNPLPPGFQRKDFVLVRRAIQQGAIILSCSHMPRLAYQATGVIYGDIGTSPLYVFSSTFSSEPSYDDLLGAVSLIIWTLTLIVTVKYVFIVLRADDEGEGGTFAVYSLLSRYVSCSNSSKAWQVRSNAKSTIQEVPFIQPLQLLGSYSIATESSIFQFTPITSHVGHA